ncbi:hypothetical protein J3459_016790 [Metarhizium acridum]|nr:hypothetical protein J3459_016790 [Metarhizium acridum]
MKLDEDWHPVRKEPPVDSFPFLASDIWQFHASWRQVSRQFVINVFFRNAVKLAAIGQVLAEAAIVVPGGGKIKKDKIQMLPSGQDGHNMAKCPRLPAAVAAIVASDRANAGGTNRASNVENAVNNFEDTNPAGHAGDTCWSRRVVAWGQVIRVNTTALNINYQH